MVLNELLVLPTPETIRMLSTIMSASPLEIRLDQAYVSLNISEASMTPKTNNVYEARAGNLGVWFDQSSGLSSLIMPLQSSQMAERVLELREEAPNTFYGGRWIGFMVLIRDCPPMNRRKSGFVNSISNTLAWDTKAMTFDAEMVRTTEVHAPPFQDFYSSNVANEWALG
jgi:hypothetical protein